MTKKNGKRYQELAESRKNRQQESQELRNFLKDREMYVPGMKLEQMRSLCDVIEESMLDEQLRQSMEQSDPQTDAVLDMIGRHKEVLLREYQPFAIVALPDVNSSFKCATKSEASGPSPPKIKHSGLPNDSVSVANQFVLQQTVASPPIIRKSRRKRSPDVNVDSSDSENWYSPDCPGPNCRVIVKVEVEIHSPPKTADIDDVEAGTSSHNLSSHNDSGKKRGIERSQEPIQWDSIDEFI
ncbi:uncharacterized protein LOC129749785 [Uranotaenia lowii]|uniref:uncharacterized protein LOC129749785 n=1 Tax=Uranotaenia lowii TaxID=190385 RepID=UPI00247A37E4|nr:uncharacterized protein LOC129749785 [Uranotaenia lowii]